MLWWFACNIPGSNVSEYSTMNISNSNVDKYYKAKKIYGIHDYNINE